MEKKITLKVKPLIISTIFSTMLISIAFTAIFVQSLINTIEALGKVLTEKQIINISFESFLLFELCIALFMAAFIYANILFSKEKK